MEITGVRRLTPEMRRATQREQTRTYLLDAAAAVFAARGYHGASLEEIAQAAGLTKGAIYSNFGSKEDLFLALVEQRQAVMLEQFFAAGAQEDPRTRIQATTDVYRRLAPTQAEWALWEEFVLFALRNAALRQKLNADGKAAWTALVRMVEQDCQDRGVEPPLPPEALARLYLAVFEGLARQRALDPSGVPDELFGTLVTFIGEAVSTLGTRRSPNAAK